MKKKRTTIDGIYRLLILILIIVAGVSIFFIVKDLSRYRKGKALYDRISDDYVLDDDENENAADGSADNDANGQSAEQKDKIILPPQIDHDGLLAENEDYIGWLRIDACGIDLPVVLGESNEEYIRTGFNGESIYQGTLFAEWKNRPDFSDPNTIIYGHNMKNRSMFGNLRKFMDEDFARENSTFWISNMDYGYLYRIYSVAIVREDGDAYTLFEDYGEEYSSYVQKRAADSMFDLGADPDFEARTVTLSTCYGPGSEGNRLIVQAYREGAYPAEGCTEDEAKKNEQKQREKEKNNRVGYIMPTENKE